MPTLEETLKPFDDRLLAAEDDDKTGIQLERSQAEGEFYRGQLTQRDIEGWRAVAAGKYPSAFGTMIVGATQEEIEASAKASHDAVRAAIEADRAAGVAAVAAAAAAAPPPAAPVDAQAAAAQGWGEPTGSAGQPPIAGELAELDGIHKGLREAYPGNKLGGTPPKPGSRVAAGKSSKVLNDLGSEDRLVELRMGSVFDQMIHNAENKAPGRAPAGQ
jgi:hypothetical protein